MLVITLVHHLKTELLEVNLSSHGACLQIVHNMSSSRFNQYKFQHFFFHGGIFMSLSECTCRNENEIMNMPT